MVKVKNLVLISVLSMFIAVMSGQVNADDKLDVSKVGETIKQMPTTISNYVSKEWEETKEFQKAGWQAGKEQTARNIATIKKFFVSLTTGKKNEE
jgi:hypothetical protein